MSALARLARLAELNAATLRRLSAHTGEAGDYRAAIASLDAFVSGAIVSGQITAAASALGHRLALEDYRQHVEPVRLHAWADAWDALALRFDPRARELAS